MNASNHIILGLIPLLIVLLTIFIIIIIWIMSKRSKKVSYEQPKPTLSRVTTPAYMEWLEEFIKIHPRAFVDEDEAIQYTEKGASNIWWFNELYDELEAYANKHSLQFVNQLNFGIIYFRYNGKAYKILNVDMGKIYQVEAVEFDESYIDYNEILKMYDSDSN